MEAGGRARVVVVGAGLAGLGAAWRLSRSGCEVELVEARSSAGGSLCGREVEGFSIDPSLQVIASRARGLLGFVNELGLNDRLLPLRPVRLGQVHHGESKAIDPTTRLGVSGIPGVRWYDAPKVLRFERLLARYRPLLDPERPERAEDLDFRSAADFARLYFGESLSRRWIGPTATATFASDAEELSRAAFLLAWAAGEGVVPGIARQGLHELARHAAEQLSMKGRTELVELSPRGKGFALELRGAQGESTLEADAVVLALGAGAVPRVAKDLLQPAERDFFGQVSYLPCVSLSLALERPLTGVPLLVRVPRDEGSGLEVHLVEPGGASGRSPTGCGLVTAMATTEFSRTHQAVDDGVVEKSLRDDLEHWYPRMSDMVRFTRLTRAEDAVPHFHVGAYRALARFRRVQEDRRGLGRRLYFAGDYLAGTTPEAAHASGERAARDLLADLASPTGA